MSLKFTDTFLDVLRASLVKGDEERIREIFYLLHPADAAEILNDLEDEEAVEAYKYLSDKVAPEALLLLDDDKREKFLRDYHQNKLRSSLLIILLLMMPLICWQIFQMHNRMKFFRL